MTETVTVAAILGALAPLVVAVLNRTSWSTELKQIVAIGAAIALALIALAVTGGFTGVTDVGALILLVVGTSQAAYALVWKPMGVAPAIEAKTSPEVTPTVEDYPELIADGATTAPRHAADDPEAADPTDPGED